ncbi:hypothetical protein PAN31117_01813 [Pandoraea anapnoica]|uniref:DUF2878 domain-containing protein n=1 Tax=Pandoraea anapnoica TaxID=2508301 RepID=A0A5E4ZV76_9BURK|nr:DUF2878 domain-containing protein [Pandoraea anapnoica]VVE65269.1 hypothetical protein PAN31117_01813 [Pandoraea anapnoica]
MRASAHLSTARAAMLRAKWLYLMLGQLGWLICVLSAARGKGWVGCCAVAFLAAVHLRFTPQRAREARFVLIVTVLGWMWESLVLATGVLTYPNGLIRPWGAPYWMAGLWMLFALQVNTLFGWLRPFPLLSLLLGAVGGTLSFKAGAMLGAVQFVKVTQAYAVLACGWAVILPGLIWMGHTLGASRTDSSGPPGSSEANCR